MKLSEYLRSKPRGEGARLCREIPDLSASFLWQIANNKAACPIRIALRIEDLTGKAVTRKDLLPKRWREIWPELAKKAA